MMKGMIRKFKSLKGLATYSDYTWDTAMEVTDDTSDQQKRFADINIIYGYNGSGKTSLSRLVRSWETGTPLPGINYKIELGEETPKHTITEQTPDAEGLYRVFNSDFIEENLFFRSVAADEQAHAAAFSVTMGEEAEAQRQRMETLKKKLGTPESEGLLYEQQNLQTHFNEVSISVATHTRGVTVILERLALDRQNGIKYNEQLRPDINYNVAALRKEIQEIQREGHTVLSEDEKQRLLQELQRRALPVLEACCIRHHSLAELAEKVMQIIRRPISGVGKLQELLQNAELSDWVEHGMELHADGICKCRFCGGELTRQRWQTLQGHFNRELNDLFADISDLDEALDEELAYRNRLDELHHHDMYLDFQEEWKTAVTDLQSTLKRREESLRHLKYLLARKKETPLLLIEDWYDCRDFEQEVAYYEDALSNVIEKINLYSQEIQEKHEQIRTKLRRNYIDEQLNKQHYHQLEELLHSSTVEKDNTEARLKDVNKEIEDTQKEWNQLRLQQLSETAAAEQINTYLKAFGYGFLSLQAEGESGISFSIMRHEERAHHLSEGESRIIAFCYFMAKLKELDTTEQKPVIWLDDPICSLDSNHIFNTYAFIRSELIDTQRFEQLFISTHNIEFLRYLTHLSGKKISSNRQYPNGVNYKKRYYMTEKYKHVSTLKPLPQYMENFVTQFNYLFGRIYRCANGDSLLEDGDLSDVATLQNVMRKFLEIYVSFHFPSGEHGDSHLQKSLQTIYGKNSGKEVYALLRICHEGSHMAGRLETAMEPPDAKALQEAAQLIIEGVKRYNPAQYEALVTSVS